MIDSGPFRGRNLVRQYGLAAELRAVIELGVEDGDDEIFGVWGWACAVLCSIGLCYAYIGSLAVEEFNHEEATFILIGQGWVDGALPYTELFDNKPPLIFFLVAAAIKSFGQEIWAVRTVGLAAMAASAWFVYLIARQLSGARAAAAASTIFVALGALPVMRYPSVELPATAFAIGALYLLICKRQRLMAVALAGVLMSLAMMTLSSLTVVAGVFGVMILFAELFLGRFEMPRWATALYILGGLLPLGALALMYTLDGSFRLFWFGTVELGVLYSQNPDYLAFAANLLSSLQEEAMKRPFLVGVAVLLFALGALISLLKLSGSESFSLVLLWVATVATFVSMVLMDGAHFSTWIQLLVLFTVFSAFLFERLMSIRLLQVFVVGFVLTACAGAIRELGQQPLRWIMSTDQRYDRYHIRDAANRIAAVMGSQDQVWAMRGHLVHWYLGNRPISPLAANPENFASKRMTKSLEELGAIPPGGFERVLASKPTFLVMERTGVPEELSNVGEVRSMIDENYRLFYRNQRLLIMRVAN